ncbi:MAG: GreA/GreB family elongation factor [Candidatus Kerfeldbacteria bacterium]|nr:GreA/GreB family elongation factor [Candidatus Kerfeldbacteria bacterium]
MRLPNRRPGKYTFPTFDHVITQEKLDEMKRELDRLLTRVRPKAISDTKRFAENGDFSENAEYQIAKGRLRGINQKIDELEFQIARAQVITAQSTDVVSIGHTVTVDVAGTKKEFTILGSSETHPERGIISYTSPLGKLLLGKSAGEKVILETATSKVAYTIVSIH